MRYKFIMAGVALTLTGCAAVNNSSADNRPLAQRSDVQHIRLANGMDVYLLSSAQHGVELRLLV